LHDERTESNLFGAIEWRPRTPEDSMIGKLVVVIPALVVLIAADTSGAQARSNAGAVVGPSQSSVKPHDAAKVKNLRGKRNPSDQGREY
jgi:hypothetical protein